MNGLLPVALPFLLLRRCASYLLHDLLQRAQCFEKQSRFAWASLLLGGVINQLSRFGVWRSNPSTVYQQLLLFCYQRRALGTVLGTRVVDTPSERLQVMYGGLYTCAHHSYNWRSQSKIYVYSHSRWGSENTIPNPHGRLAFSWAQPVSLC